MNLTEELEIIQWPATHYVFVEKSGPFMKTAPEAWGQAHGLLPLLMEQNQVKGYMSLYKMGPDVYRAGFALEAAAEHLPEGLRYELFPGGAYYRFTLTGPYSDLPQASGRVFAIASEKNLMLRQAYCIENYVKDPRTTPAAELVTEILLPVG